MIARAGEPANDRTCWAAGGVLLSHFRIETTEARLEGSSGEGAEGAVWGHPDGEAERFHETPRARRPLSRDVERGPMIHRSPDNRQSHGHIDRPIEISELDRDMPLVVIHRHDEIEIPFDRPVKEGVGG